MLPLTGDTNGNFNEASFTNFVMVLMVFGFPTSLKNPKNWLLYLPLQFGISSFTIRWNSIYNREEMVWCRTTAQTSPFSCFVCPWLLVWQHPTHEAIYLIKRVWPETSSVASLLVEATPQRRSASLSGLLQCQNMKCMEQIQNKSHSNEQKIQNKISLNSCRIPQGNYATLINLWSKIKSAVIP